MLLHLLHVEDQIDTPRAAKCRHSTARRRVSHHNIEPHSPIRSLRSPIDRNITHHLYFLLAPLRRSSVIEPTKPELHRHRMFNFTARYQHRSGAVFINTEYLNAEYDFDLAIRLIVGCY